MSYIVKLYARKIKDGLIVLSDVPPMWREDVRKYIEGE